MIGNVPTALWLTLGGDHRLLLNPMTGLNQYYCSPCPAPEVGAWGSCTASTPGHRAYSAAGELQKWLSQEQEDGADRSWEAADEIRSEIRKWAGLDNRVDIILTPSATDAEFIPLWLCLAHDDRVLNILVGPLETGSGSGYAASGCHISSITPSGTTVLMNAPLEQLRDLPIRTEEYDIRGPDGEFIETEKFEKSIADSITHAIEQGEKVLLHHIDCSKTGARLPSIDFCSELQRKHGEQVRVVVDAAQLRTEPSEIRNWLDRGWAVLISGSKFYCGPPFCGAVLLPQKPWHSGAQVVAPPVGFRDYFSGESVPESWTLWRQRLPTKANRGMLLRWKGALAEMQSYAEIPRAKKFLAIKKISEVMQDAIGACDHVERIQPHWELKNVQEKDFEEMCMLTTIETFRIRFQNGAAKSKPLTLYECRTLHRMLRENMASNIGAQSDNSLEQALSRPYALGQAVSIGTASNGSLRLAASAPMIIGICEGSLKIEELRSDLTIMFSKLGECLERFQHEIRPTGNV